MFDVAAVTPANAESKVKELADQLAVTLPLPLSPTADVRRHSLLAEAKTIALHTAARNVNNQAAAAVPDVIEQLRPGFERAVSAFVESVKNLPDELTSEALVQAGPSVLSEYQNACAAVSDIKSMDSWLTELINLPAFAGLPSGGVVTVLSPSSRGELAKLLTAHGNQKADWLEVELGGAYVEAARHGIEFRLNTPAESAKVRADIDSAPREKPKGVAYLR